MLTSIAACLINSPVYSGSHICLFVQSQLSSFWHTFWTVVGFSELRRSSFDTYEESARTTQHSLSSIPSFFSKMWLVSCYRRAKQRIFPFCFQETWRNSRCFCQSCCVLLGLLRFWKNDIACYSAVTISGWWRLKNKWMFLKCFTFPPQRWHSPPHPGQEDGARQASRQNRAS